MGVQYPLYTHAHYGYGLNDAFDRSVALLVSSTEASPAHESPQSGRTGQQQQHWKDGEQSSKEAPTAYNPDVMRVMQPGKGGSYAAPNARSSRGLKGGGGASALASESVHRFSQGSQLQAAEAGSMSEPRYSADNDMAELELSGGLPERADRQLRANLPQLIHPCLHNGYSKPYRRMVADGVLPKPAIVQLIGR